jgi:excisionase family DNA binding protein
VSEHLLTAREVAELLGVSPATVLDRFQHGDLPGYRLFGKKGGPVRFRLTEIEARIEGWRVSGPGAGGEVSPAPTADPTLGVVYEASPAPHRGGEHA